MSITRGIPCDAPSSRYANAVPPTVIDRSNAVSNDAAMVLEDLTAGLVLSSLLFGCDEWMAKSQRGEESPLSVMRYEREILEVYLYGVVVLELNW
jgi:hypothetical protein